MNVLNEQEFTINGVKSWIHCLYRHLEPTPDSYVVPYHYHGYIEFLYSLSSDANIWINGECHRFRTGDLAIINSEELHDVTANAASDYICVKFSPHVLYADEQALLEFKYVAPFLKENPYKVIYHKDEIQNIDIFALANEIMKEWNEKNPAYELIIRADILKIFSEIIRIRSRGNNSVPEIVLNESIKTAISYIHTNFSTVTEKDAAKICGLCYTHFSYAFKKALGKSFNDYLTQIKLREAEKQLILTDKSITEIAMDVGFSTASHFILRFKEAKQITPSKFRKKIRGNEPSLPDDVH